MADKQQNILVNFKYNTAELEKGTNLVNRANEANNKLQQGADQAGKSIGSSFRAAAPSIAHLTAEQKRLEDAIKSTKATSFATFKEFTKSLQGLSAQYAKVKSDIAAANKELANQAKVTKQSAAAVGDLSQGFGQLFTAIKLVIGAGIARELVNTTLEAAKLAGNVEGVERAFKRTFPGSIGLMRDLQQSTHGTVTEFELMQRTLQATNLGVAVESLPILFEFAAARAQQTGESVDYLVDSIVRGIGRKSILVLDNLGLSATRLREQFNGASLASQSVADVTRGVAEIAKVELDKMGGYAETSATKVDQLSVSWQNLRLELAKKVSGESGGIMQFFKDAIDGTTAALKSNEELRQGIAENAALVEFNSLKESRINDKKINDQQKLIDAIQDEIRVRLQSLKENNVELLILKKRYDEAAKSREGSLSERYNRKIQIAEEGNAISQNNLFLTETIKLLRFYYEGFKKESPKAVETLETLREKLKELKEQIEDTPTSEIGVMKGLEKQADKVQEKIDKIIASIYFLGKQAPNVEITVSVKPESDLREGIPLASEGLRPDQMTDLLNSDRTDLSGTFEKSKRAADDFKKALDDLIKTIPDLVPPTQYTRDQIREMIGDFALFKAELSTALADAEDEIKTTGIDIFAEQLISIEDAEVASLQNRLNNLRNFYDEQQILAGDNDRAKQALRLKEERETAELQKKIAQKQKEARRFSVIIDTAAGIARAFATAPNIAVAIVQAALVAAQGASQLAIINRTQARFAKGVIDLKGPGTGTSDSIHARLSRGESVMTAKETKGSMGILKDIRAKKLNDNVLQSLKLTTDGVRNVGMDDSRIVKEIRDLKNSQPNIIEQSGRLYKQYNRGKNYKVKIHIKNMGY